MDAGNVTQAGLGTLGSGAALGGLLSGGMAAIPGWGWAALAAANLLPAVLGSSAQERQRKREADLRAAEIEASPWTGRGPSTQMQTPESNVWANLLGAGTNVLGQGQQLEAARRASQWGDLMTGVAQSMTPEELKQMLMSGKMGPSGMGGK